MGLVLVVESDAARRAVVCQALRTRGLWVECVPDTGAAYARIPGLPTLKALVLETDPGQGAVAFEVARFARRVIPDLAVVYVGGAAGRAAVEAQAGAEAAFVERPAIGELAEVVARKLGQG